MELDVTDHPEQARFEARADGEVVGFVDYQVRDGEIALLHTETDSRLRRQGIGGRLVQSALDSARERHLAVLPYCSFVRRWIADHPEYADLVPAGDRRQFGLLGTDEFDRAASFHGRDRRQGRAGSGEHRRDGRRGDRG